MTVLEAIALWEEKDASILKKEKWLQFLVLTKTSHYNLERVQSLSAEGKSYVFAYVKRTLSLLAGLEKDEAIDPYIEAVLKWSEVAKAGLPHQRDAWYRRGYNLFVHNMGSGDIYEAYEKGGSEKDREIITTLIRTHGLIGQYLRGEVSLGANDPMIKLLEKGYFTGETLKKLLLRLNYCIVAGVSVALWESVRLEVEATIDKIIREGCGEEVKVIERIRALRKTSVKSGENLEPFFEKYSRDPLFKACFEYIFSHYELWYVEAALHDFSIEEFYKIFLMIYQEAKGKNIAQISFENMMKVLYYDRFGVKKVNLYKKRVIEKYLKDLSVEDILLGRGNSLSAHLKHQLKTHRHIQETVFFEFEFSPAAAALFAFCEEAEKADVLYEKAIIMLYDLFGFRKDSYDRFYEEERYLETMNQSIDYKKVIMDYVVGDTVIDIGPGGGALMDMMAEFYPEKKIIGVDISSNVLEVLSKRKNLEGRRWEVKYGDALNLKAYFQPGEVQTIIFCSILHELFSYIEWEGKKFNHQVLKQAFVSAFEILPVGGRIIIRDGIMTEPEDQMRRIQFLSEEGLSFLEKYQQDFKGREIHYQVVAHNEVLMSVNDAMEFLYTYTWGEDSYIHEINEQFGYFTPSKYHAFIEECLGEEAEFVVEKHYLQQGYTLALSSKIRFMNGEGTEVPLPDSTCFIVIEKRA